MAFTPTVLQIITDALTEIGVLAENESPSAATSALALRYFQRQIDSWGADQVTLSVQLQQAMTWPAATSTQTIGPGGNLSSIARPTWINQLTYTVLGSSPAVEVPISPMDRDSYAAESIKTLASTYPTQFFYQTSTDSNVGTLYLWPQPSGSLTINLYAPKAVATPSALTDVLYGPPGYQEAYHYQLALRLCQPFGRPIPPALPTLAQEAYLRLKRPNVQPGLMGVDAALTPSTGGGYNILNDTTVAPTR